MVKNPPAIQELQATWVRYLGQEYAWKRAWLLAPIFLPGEFHGQRSLADYCPQCHKESDTSEVTEQALIYLQKHIQLVPELLLLQESNETMYLKHLHQKQDKHVFLKTIYMLIHVYYIYTYICMCVCVYIYIYIYIHLNTCMEQEMVTHSSILA